MIGVAFALVIDEFLIKCSVFFQNARKRYQTKPGPLNKQYSKYFDKHLYGNFFFWSFRKCNKRFDHE